MAIFDGTAGPDIINGTDDPDTINGFPGNDTIHGNGGADLIDAGSGIDQVFGDGGDDTFRVSSVSSGAGISTYDGGAGFDTLDYSLADTPLAFARSTTTAGAFTVGDNMVTNVEKVIGGSAADTFYFEGLSIEAHGGGGDDVFTATTGIDVFYGDAGNDDLGQLGSGDSVYGGDGDDKVVISGVFGAPSTPGLVDGGAGTDEVSLNVSFVVDLAARTAVSGTMTYSLISIERVLAAAKYAEFPTTVLGDDGANYIAVNPLLEGTGAMTFDGRGGDDTIGGSLGDDTLSGGAGVDTVTYANATAAVRVSLANTAAQNTLSAGIDTLTGFERLVGSGFADTLTGDGGANTITGGGGNDTIDGGGGIDVAVYSGRYDQATITFSNGGTAFVSTAAGGVDTLSNVEFLQFDDRLVSVDGLFFGDTTGPVPAFFAPVDGAAGLGVSQNITIAFNEAIRRGVGLVRITDDAGHVVESFDIATSNRLVVTGQTVTIDPTANLSALTHYTVSIDAGGLTDIYANPSNAISGYDFTTLPAPTTGAEVRLIAADGFVGAVGGASKIFGAAGYQDLTIVNKPGTVILDASFNGGGDRIHLSGNASAYTITHSGSTAILSDGDTIIDIPVGTVGLDIVFDDGARSLKFDLAAGLYKLGDQTIGLTAQAITAASQGLSTVAHADAAASARLVVSDDSPATVGGNVTVFGSHNVQDITVLAGSVVHFDASFNTGGDSIALPGNVGDYTAIRSGSSMTLTSATTQVFIPLGDSGTTLHFGDTDRLLFFDTAAGHGHVGSQIVDATSVQLFGAWAWTPSFA